MYPVSTERGGGDQAPAQDTQHWDSKDGGFICPGPYSGCEQEEAAAHQAVLTLKPPAGNKIKLLKDKPEHKGVKVGSKPEV